MRAIDGDKLIEFFFDLCGDNESTSVKAGIAAIVTVIQADQLAVTIDDLRPKGRWLHHENGVAYCSECEMDAVEDGTNFCPECGADMRGGGKDA